jgi:hypothetical protein
VGAALAGWYPSAHHLTPAMPIIHLRSISDDDLCATCSRCSYRPGEESGCSAGFPGAADADDYIEQCDAFDPIQAPAP